MKRRDVITNAADHSRVWFHSWMRRRKTRVDEEKRGVLRWGVMREVMRVLQGIKLRACNRPEILVISVRWQTNGLSGSKVFFTPSAALREVSPHCMHTTYANWKTKLNLLKFLPESFIKLWQLEQHSLVKTFNNGKEPCEPLMLPHATDSVVCILYSLV